MAFTVEQLKNFKTTLSMMSGKEFVPLKPEVLARMANLWRTRTVGFSKTVQTIDECIAELVKYHHDWQACGCMGARDGWEWCGCELWSMMEIYRIDIAIHILETHSEATSYEDLVEIQKLVNHAV